MDRAVPPPAEEDPFEVNRVPDDVLDVSVPFELEDPEWDWEAGGSPGGASADGGCWGAPGDYGIE